MLRHKLVLEPGVYGHEREWLWHLIRYLEANPAHPPVTLLVAESVRQELAGGMPPGLEARVRVIALGRREQHLCDHRRLVVSAFARWWTMRRYLRRSGAAVGHFLTLDHVSLPLALGFGFGGRLVEGVLFRPSVHYGGFGAERPSLKERLRDWRKAVLYRRMLSNRSLHQVLTLDPYFPDHARHRYRFGDKVRTLPDPVHPPIAYGEADAALARSIPAGRRAFVLFGVLTERKGVLALLRALELLKPQAAARAAVLLAGRLDDSIRPAVEAQLARLAKLKPELWLRLENRSLALAEIAALVVRSDVVLAPYQRFVGSSGVLLWAAGAGRPVLSQGFGLVGRLIREHRLGLAVDTTDALALATAMGRMIDDGAARFIDPGRVGEFVAGRRPERFAELVLEDA